MTMYELGVGVCSCLSMCGHVCAHDYVCVGVCLCMTVHMCIWITVHV